MTGYAPLTSEEVVLVRKLLTSHRKRLMKALYDENWLGSKKTRERLHGEVDLCDQIAKKLR